MGVSNRERIGKALDFLRQGLYFYAEQKMQAVHGSTWMTKAASHLRDHQKSKQQVDDIIREEVRPLPVSPVEESRIRHRLDELLKRIPFQNAHLLS